MDVRIQDILAFADRGRGTDRARNCIVRAVDYADEHGHREFNSCHFLSGLTREPGGVAFAVLRNLGVTNSRIGDSLRNHTRSVAEQFQVHSELKTVFDVAFAAADKMSHNYVGAVNGKRQTNKAVHNWHAIVRSIAWSPRSRVPGDGRHSGIDRYSRT